MKQRRSPHSLGPVSTYRPRRVQHLVNDVMFAESDSEALTVVDCVCAAFNQSAGRPVVYMRRELRRSAGSTANTLRPNFELVASYGGSITRGPFSVQRWSHGNYRFYTPLPDDPPRIWEGKISSRNGYLDYSVVVSDTRKQRTPARGSKSPMSDGLPVRCSAYRSSFYHNGP